VVDDFGIKYSSWAGTDHLIATLQALYPLKVDWSGSQYHGMTITRDRLARTLSLSLPEYIAKVLQRFKRAGSKHAASSRLYVSPVYGARVQYVNDQTPDACPLAAAEITEIQGIVGSLLYYARAIYPTMLPAVTAIDFVPHYIPPSRSPSRILCRLP